MNQDEINQAEWNDRKNWSFIVYHSERDTRMWVPKRFGWGWTINLRSKTCARLLLGILLAAAFIGLIVSLGLLVIFPKR